MLPKTGRRLHSTALIINKRLLAVGDPDIFYLGIEGLWYWGSRQGSRMVEEEAAATMKRTWVNYGLYHDTYIPVGNCSCIERQRHPLAEP